MICIQKRRKRLTKNITCNIKWYTNKVLHWRSILGFEDDGRVGRLLLVVCTQF